MTTRDLSPGTYSGELRLVGAGGAEVERVPSERGPTRSARRAVLGLALAPIALLLQQLYKFRISPMSLHISRLCRMCNTSKTCLDQSLPNESL